MDQDDMRLTVNRGIMNAKMTKRPLIIVEGKDDLPIYIELAKQVNNKFQVKPIEYFKGCAPGCTTIERKVEEINEIYSSGHDVYNSFIGIVDRDAKEFRHEFKNLNGLFYLKTYSFENTFVTKNSLLNTVRYLTSATTNELNNTLAEVLLSKINNGPIDFYYATLEALKNATETAYIGLVGFSDGYDEAIYNSSLIAGIQTRKSDLDNFAFENGLSNNCIINMNTFCKGKWHLKYYIRSICKYTENIHELCGEGLTKCTYCEVNNTANCLYKIKKKIDPTHIISIITSDLKNSDLDYVKVELAKLTA